MAMENKNYTDENISVQEKENQKKVEQKPITTKRVKSTSKTKDCPVLLYNAIKKTAVISFDGFGYELKDIAKNPGNKITVKYSGDVHSPDFKLEV